MAADHRGVVASQSKRQAAGSVDTAQPEDTLMRPTILALDLEGTLISNAVSQIPRPGLYTFLEQMREQFDHLVMFTTVDEGLFRRIAALLVIEGQAPAWFSELGYTTWVGATKDLTYVSPTLGKALLLDDHGAYVHAGQKPWWIEVPLFGSPYEATDAGLNIAQQRIEQRLRELIR